MPEAGGLVWFHNGLELARHRFVNDLLVSESYFCKPYSSWEKGGVENDNGLVRQYFPKGSDFTGITLERLQEVEDEINNRPRREANNHKQRSDSKNPHLDIP